MVEALCGKDVGAISMRAAMGTSIATQAMAGSVSMAAGRTCHGPESKELLQRGEGREGLSPEARDRFQERGGGAALGGLAGAGAAGAAGAALGQRLSGGDQVRGNADRAVVQDRGQQQRPATQQRQASPQREAVQQRGEAQNRPTAQQRPAPQERQATRERPAQVERPAAQRPAARQQLPPDVMRDAQARQVGNQREMASRQYSRPPGQFSPSASFGGSRSMGLPGSFSGGGRGGGFGGGRGGGRR